MILGRKHCSRTSVCISVTKGLTVTLCSCGLMSKSRISEKAYDITVKLAFEEGSLIKGIKIQEKMVVWTLEGVWFGGDALG